MKYPQININSYPSEISYPLTPDSSVKLVKHFESDLSLDKLNNAQLSSICMNLGKSGWGFSWMLKNRINNYLAQLALDDKLIQKEGILSYNEDEIEEASKERGLFVDLSFEKLKTQLEAWLKLSQTQPEVLLKLIILHHGYLKTDMWLTV